MSITINPYIQTSAVGSFSLSADGVICGTAWPDPAARFALSGGILDESEVLPMWGGVAINELIPATPVNSPGAPIPELGGHIVRATTEAEIVGWSVFDQNYAAINAPQSPVPQTANGGFVSYYRLGCGIRIAVPLDPALALEGAPVNAPVGWDFDNQWLTVGAAGLPVRVLRVWPGGCMAPIYDGGPTAAPPGQGFLDWDRNAAAAIILL